jgi:UDPglucose 6-dehydrogenase
VKVGIVGYGVVGKAVRQCLSSNEAHTTVVYDKFQKPFDGPYQQQEINSCDLVFVCVPTPSRNDRSCDISAVEECVGWITRPICIKSTVIPGTVERLSNGNKQIAFSPEYIGQESQHPWKAISSCGFVIVGGPPGVRELVIKALRCCLSCETVIRETDSRTAELCKYMENCFLATKVAFVNQFFEIAKLMGVDFQELRDLWLTDPRIGPSHTVVTEERGFGGACLPKDLDALIAAMATLGGAVLLDAVASYNRKTRRNLSATVDLHSPRM